MEYNELLTGLETMMNENNNATTLSQPVNNYITQEIYNNDTDLMNDIGTLIQRQEGNQ